MHRLPHWPQRNFSPSVAYRPATILRRFEHYDQDGNSGHKDQHSHTPRQIGEQVVENSPNQHGRGHAVGEAHFWSAGSDIAVIPPLLSVI